MTLMDFLTVTVLAFAIFLVLAGLFTAGFGNGRSRMAGILMIVVGLVVGVVWIILGGGFNIIEPVIDVDVKEVFLNALVNFVGVLIGALVAIGIFLLAVLKS